MLLESTPTHEGRRIRRRQSCGLLVSLRTLAFDTGRGRRRTAPERFKGVVSDDDSKAQGLPQKPSPTAFVATRLFQELETRRRHHRRIDYDRSGHRCTALQIIRAKRGAVAPRSACTAPGRQSSARDAAAVTRSHELRRDEPHLRRDAHYAPLLQPLHPLANDERASGAHVRL